MNLLDDLKAAAGDIRYFGGRAVGQHLCSSRGTYQSRYARQTLSGMNSPGAAALSYIGHSR
jgi:hypothetical protein